jgi:hypothetical protein
MDTRQVQDSWSMAGQVRRYHTWPVLRQQTLAQHSWRVATICVELSAAVGRRPSPELLTWCLLHDTLVEPHTGDLPHHVKRDNPALKAALTEIEAPLLEAAGLPVLSPFQVWVLKLCDLLEMWEFGMEEQAMGNRFGGPVVANMEAALERHVGDSVETDARRPFITGANKFMTRTKERLR